jgi:hypothetical protein
MGWQVRLHLLSQWSRGSGNIEGLAPELVKEHKCGSLFPVFKTKHELHSLAQRSGEVRFQEEVETKVVEPAGEGPNNVPTSLDLPRSAPLIVNHRWAGAGNDGSMVTPVVFSGAPMPRSTRSPAVPRTRRAGHLHRPYESKAEKRGSLPEPTDENC